MANMLLSLIGALSLFSKLEVCAATGDITNHSTFEQISGNTIETTPVTIAISTDVPLSTTLLVEESTIDSSVLCEEMDQDVFHWRKEVIEKCNHGGPMFTHFLAFLMNEFNHLTCGDRKEVQQTSYLLHCSFQALYDLCVPDVTTVKGKQSNKLQDLPPLEASVNAITTLCMVNKSLAWPCLTGQLDPLQSCVHTEVTSYLQMQGKEGSYRDIELCQYKSFITMCTMESLEICGPNTAHPMLMIFGHDFTFPGCDNSLSSMNKPSCSILVQVALMSLFTMTHCSLSK